MLVDELVHRACPEGPADHRRRLERRLLGGVEEIDARGENGVDRVRHAELVRQRVQCPLALLAHEQTAVDHHAEQLLDEEGVSVGAVDDELTQICGQHTGEELVEHAHGVVRRERLQLDDLAGGARTPTGSAFQQLGPRSRDQEQRSARVGDNRLEQVEQLVVGPVHVFDEHDRGTVRGDFGQELGPGVLETVASRERVKMTDDIEPKCEAEDLASVEPLERQLRRIALEQAEMLLQHLTQRPVRRPRTVREAATGAAQRLGLLLGEQLPELPREPRLPDACVADDRHELRPSLLDGGAIRAAQKLELLIATDEREPEAADAARTHERQCAHEPARDDALGLSFRLDRDRRIELEGTAGGRDRALADEDLAGCGRLL